MALQATGFSLVLTALRNAGINVRIYGLSSTDSFATSQSYESGSQSITWASGSPSQVTSTLWKLESDVSAPPTFVIATGSLGTIRITGLRLLNSSNEVLLDKSFGQNFDFAVNGEFTLEKLTIEAT